MTRTIDPQPFDHRAAARNALRRPVIDVVEAATSLAWHPGLDRRIVLCGSTDLSFAESIPGSSMDAPSVLPLFRQAVPQPRRTGRGANLAARGTWMVHPPDTARDITPLATKAEVSSAATVVPIPCRSLFEAEAEDCRNLVLGQAPRLSVKAASPFGWTCHLAQEADAPGLTGFGASASAEELASEVEPTGEWLCNRAGRA